MEATRGDGGELVVRIDGVFDGRAASRLNSWLGEAPAGDHLVIDFGAARECQDLGLAALARALSARGDRVMLRGLNRHQVRLLRYFGVEAEPPPPGADEQLG
jgi:hypothetical protein